LKFRLKLKILAKRWCTEGLYGSLPEALHLITPIFLSQRHVVDTESFADKYFFYCFAEVEDLLHIALSPNLSCLGYSRRRWLGRK